MNRFTTDRLKAAAEVTGWGFVNQKWVEMEDNCACGMSQLLIAECGVSAKEVFNRAQGGGDMLGEIAPKLGVPPVYALGFMHGFDSEGDDVGPYPGSVETYQAGFKDGLSARREFIDVQP